MILEIMKLLIFNKLIQYHLTLYNNSIHNNLSLFK